MSVTTVSDAADSASYRLDSTYFISFSMSHETLRRALKASSPLNIMQYRILIRAFLSSPAATPQSVLIDSLGLKPSAAAQATAVLEEASFIVRQAGRSDARARDIFITEDGVAHIAQVNAALVDELYRSWPTDTPLFRDILETVVYAGARIDPILSSGNSERFPASHVVTTVELIAHRLEYDIVAGAGASLGECRIMQRLCEVGRPLRIGDLADQIFMNNATATRNASKLCGRGWARKLVDPHDSKAVYLDLTEAGAQEAQRICRIIDEAAYTRFWSIMNEEQREAFRQLGSVVIADLRRKKEAERLSALSLLRPMD